MNTDSYMHSLLVTNLLRESTLRAVIATLKLPSGSCGLDAGCGVGLQCLLLAEAVGPTGHVTGLDVATEFLHRGGEIVKAAGLSERISFQEGDVANIPFSSNTFDWVWSADCIGYGPWEPLPLLRELTRVVKPGGIVAISGWSSENVLPGYPRLEARLRATSSGIAPFVHGKKPETHFLRALNWLLEIGLKEPRAKVFADSFHAPLNHGVRNALESLFDMRWPDVEIELSSDDQREFRRLCQPDSPDFILNNSDYYAFFTYFNRYPGGCDSLQLCGDVGGISGIGWNLYFFKKNSVRSGGGQWATWGKIFVFSVIIVGGIWALKGRSTSNLTPFISHRLSR